MSSTSTKPEEPWLLYDGECPFCSAYVKLVRLRDSIGQVRLIDARDGGPELAELEAKGLDINEGMAMKYEGKIYYGDECIHVLSLLSTASGPFNSFNAWVFKSEARSKALYPFLRAGRNTALKILGRKKIDRPEVSPSA
ncbi:DUF393 domain-containing protein [Parvularcula sp. ZS-1/3]|uniref:DUF393 domain-containing protein n=1 Tax=Parvularcula mediterranea TaxID=2732508 RepID=A0A7Y3RP74_9PROT|nr:DCC1-like thiol-disulfide oxidoreductase family protein [Parvularcula mediterranea]NNU16842.1 DUF393 domain-containing protein [Parvularcula mediterranea]